MLPLHHILPSTGSLETFSGLRCTETKVIKFLTKTFHYVFKLEKIFNYESYKKGYTWRDIL